MSTRSQHTSSFTSQKPYHYDQAYHSSSSSKHRPLTTIRGSTELDAYSGTMAIRKNGVQIVVSGLQYTISTWHSSVAAIPTAGPLTAATTNLGKRSKARMNTDAGDWSILFAGSEGQQEEEGRVSHPSGRGRVEYYYYYDDGVITYPGSTWGH